MTVFWVAAVILVLIGVRLMGSRPRVLMHDAGYFSPEPFRTAARYLSRNANHLNMLYVGATFGVVVGATYVVFGEDRLLEGLVLGLAILTLMFVHGPRMGVPVISAAWLPAADGGTYHDTPRRSVSIPSQETSLLFFRVSNLGMNYYENCTARLCFPEGFKILRDEVLYDDIDFRKTLLIQTHNRCAVFQPGVNYLGVAPGNHLVFPVWVESPKTARNYEVRILFDSQSRWGEAQTKLWIEVIER